MGENIISTIVRQAWNCEFLGFFLRSLPMTSDDCTPNEEDKYGRASWLLHRPRPIKRMWIWGSLLLTKKWKIFEHSFPTRSKPLEKKSLYRWHGATRTGWSWTKIRWAHFGFPAGAAAPWSASTSGFQAWRNSTLTDDSDVAKKMITAEITVL